MGNTSGGSSRTGRMKVNILVFFYNIDRSLPSGRRRLRQFLHCCDEFPPMYVDGNIGADLIDETATLSR
jgi:hypothetical protein